MDNCLYLGNFIGPNFIILSDEENDKINGGGVLFTAFICGVIVCFLWETGNRVSLYYTSEDLGYWSGQLMQSAWNWVRSQF